MLYTAESAQFYSAFSPTTISLTLRFRRKREVWLRFFAENAQYNPKTHSYEDNAKFNSKFSATTLSCASRFRRKRGVIKNFEYLGELKEYFRKCWLYCVLHLFVTERCQKKFKNRRWKSRACVPLRFTCTCLVEEIQYRYRNANGNLVLSGWWQSVLQNTTAYYAQNCFCIFGLSWRIKCFCILWPEWGAFWQAGTAGSVQ